jgi:hypothetical protein
MSESDSQIATKAAPAEQPRSRPVVHVVWGSVIVLALVIGYLVFRYPGDKVAAGGEALRQDLKTAAATVYEDGKKGARDFGKFALEMAGRFNQGIQRGEIIEGTTKVDGKIRLELATAEITEIFRDSHKQTLWKLYLGETVAEITVPATFRYHLDPAGKWEIRARDRAAIVVAPPIEPSLPVAIHTDRMEMHRESGWARFDKDKRLEQLQRSITPELGQRAGDAAHIDQVREQARREVARFVRTWLMKEDMWREDAFTSVVVLFPDETAQPETAQPTITLQQ